MTARSAGNAGNVRDVRDVRPRRGYTIIEVMMALAVLTMGAAGVIAMQKATIVSNTNARNLATANLIAQGWVERLRADSLSWNEPALQSDLTETEWLTKAVNTEPVAGDGWFVPDTIAAGKAAQPSGASLSDVMGSDWIKGVDDPSIVSAFCTQIRLTRFSTARPQIGPPMPPADISAFFPVIRVEVRVVWDRRGAPLTCAGLPKAFDSDVGNYGLTYLVSAVMENASPI